MGTENGHMAGIYSGNSSTNFYDFGPHNDTYNYTSHVNDSEGPRAGHSEHYDYDDNYYSYDEYYYYDHLYEIFDFEIPILGYIWPVLVIFTTCCNCLVIGGFLRKRMRNATNLILVFIAVSDSLTGLVTLPATFHIFTKENFVLTKDWCNAAMITRLYISRAFHTVSVWETLLLGVHRFLQVRYPNLAKKFCTVPKTLAAILMIYILSFALHIYHAFDIKAVNGMCEWSIQEPCGWTCAYIWLTMLLCHLLPSFALAVLAIKMVRTLKEFGHESSVYNRADKRSQNQRNVTLVVIFVVVIFLVPELPYGIFYLITVSLRHAGKRIFPLRTNRLIHCIYEVLLVVSFHLNFWVYCIIIRSFRSCIKSLLRLVTCRPADFERLEGEVTSSSGGGLELVGMTTETDTELK
ncbi:sex peptide receptor-like [Mercenaria mercenaria]|uniref:sex peptide receptor-like n=1 Tax=Mercenaria mercenaria TaxID=6596 RepID=UPI001E1D7310|nr:sex peptide receptor-like [Mercenaria mercenaria]XP_045163029.1 sex peptide receptor-like [Mercenaria mercenaria]XP_045163030.1 sex peptide receptor-like [Mercenaria mercenaria]XP_053379497.1 sex peptide receptor-like [Mercenaria mercenaria]